MTTCTLFLFAFGMIMLMSCNGPGSSGPALDVENNQTIMQGEGGGVSPDNDTELQSFNGLTVDRVYTVDSEDKRTSNNLIATDTKFSIMYEGVENYTLKNGKAFPVTAMLVTDGSQQPLISHDNLLSSCTDDLNIEDASVLRTTVVAGEPTKAGSYSCSITKTDKNNKDVSILSPRQFDVK